MAAISGTTAAVITAVTAVASLAGTVVSGIAQQQAAQQQAEQQEAAARYQQQVADRNRQIAQQNQELAEEQARAARKEGWDAAVKRRQEVASIIGAQRARQGASGTAIDAGSNLDLNMSTAEQGEIDALALQQQGLDKARNLEMQAWGYGNEAQNQQSASQNYAWQASNVQGPSGLATAGTILGAVGQAGSMFGSNLWGGTSSAAPSTGKHWDRALQQWVGSPVRH